MTEPYVVRSGHGEMLPLRSGTTLRLLAGARSTGGAFTVLDGTHPPGGGPPWHVHRDVDEAFFVLDGSYRFFAGKDEIVAGPGDFVFLPAQVPHRYAVGPAGGRALYLYAPAGIEGYFTARSEAEARGDLTAMHRLADDYGFAWLPDCAERPG